MKIGCLSDIHGNWENLINSLKDECSDIDLLILAGDLCSLDSPSYQESELREWFPKFYDLFDNRPEVVIVPGNHDFLLERIYEDAIKLRDIFKCRVKILVDSSYDVISDSGEIFKLYGNPRSDSYSFAFPHLHDYSDLDNIPGDTDILITHEAPRLNTLPCITEISYSDGSLPGNDRLAARVLEIKPKIHIFGHIHYPVYRIIDGISFINVSQIDKGDCNPYLYKINI